MLSIPLQCHCITVNCLFIPPHSILECIAGVSSIFKDKVTYLTLGLNIRIELGGVKIKGCPSVPKDQDSAVFLLLVVVFNVQTQSLTL